MKVKLESFDESEHRRQKLEREKQDLVAELEKLSLIQVRNKRKQIFSPRPLIILTWQQWMKVAKH